MKILLVINLLIAAGQVTMERVRTKAFVSRERRFSSERY